MIKLKDLIKEEFPRNEYGKMEDTIQDILIGDWSDIDEEFHHQKNKSVEKFQNVLGGLPYAYLGDKNAAQEDIEEIKKLWPSAKKVLSGNIEKFYKKMKLEAQKELDAKIKNHTIDKNLLKKIDSLVNKLK